SVFLGPFIWGLFTKNANRIAAVTSSVSALVICLYLYFTGTPSPQAGSIGMIISLLAVPVLSFIIPKK
ncbi:sodium:solute symporter, partial [Bacteroidota bacterium]